MNPSDWVDQYADYLFSVAFMKTGNREDAQDLVQETFLSAYKGLAGFRGDSSVKTWLTQILKNKLVDYFRKKNRASPVEKYLDTTSEAFHQSFFDGGNFGRFKQLVRPNFFSTGGEEYLLGNEFQKILETCLMKMPEKLRAIFVAKYLDDQGSGEICKEHSISSSNYWVIVHRAKVLLRGCLEKQGILPTS